jgi:hypothetical protein
LLRTSISAEI